jgi:hemoglobin
MMPAALPAPDTLPIMSDTPPQPIETIPEPTPYDLVGGADAVRRIVDRFYDIMDTAPAAAGIRAMHDADLGPMRQRLFEFMSAWLGGPPIYVVGPGQKCIMSTHRSYMIGAAERDAWMLCMRRALADTGAPQEVRDLIDAPLMRMANAFRTPVQA